MGFRKVTLIVLKTCIFTNFPYFAKKNTWLSKKCVSFNVFTLNYFENQGFLWIIDKRVGWNSRKKCLIKEQGGKSASRAEKKSKNANRVGSFINWHLRVGPRRRLSCEIFPAKPDFYLHE